MGDAGRLDGPDLLELHLRVLEVVEEASTVAEHPDGRLAGFLIGFLSPTDPGTGYVHFVGVDPATRRSGLGAALYQRFFDDAGSAGVRTVRAVTSPINTPLTVVTNTWSSPSLAKRRATSSTRRSGRMVEGAGIMTSRTRV